MSSQLSRTLLVLLAFGVVLGLVFGGGGLLRWAVGISTSYGIGFVLMVGLMTLLVLISIVRMPLSHAGRPHRRHR